MSGEVKSLKNSSKIELNLHCAGHSGLRINSIHSKFIYKRTRMKSRLTRFNFIKETRVTKELFHNHRFYTTGDTIVALWLEFDFPPKFTYFPPFSKLFKTDIQNPFS